MNTYWKIGCVVAIVAIAFAGGWYVNGSRMQARIEAMQRAQAEAIAESEAQVAAYKEKASEAVNSQAMLYQEKVAAADKDIEKLKKELKDAKIRNPLPADCRLDPDRMRIIKTATAIANASGSASR